MIRRGMNYSDLPLHLRSAVLPHVRNMIVHDHRAAESALRVPSGLRPVLANGSSLSKVQLRHFHLDGQSRRFYSDLQTHRQAFHDMIHGQNPPEKMLSYAKIQTDTFLNGVRLQHGARHELAGEYQWLHDILLKKRPSMKVWISVGSSFALMDPASFRDTHVAFLVSLTLCILVYQADNESAGKLT